MTQYQRIEEKPIITYHGVFKRGLSLIGAVILIISGTVGAGVLGLPYAIAKVGITLGLFYIVGAALLIICLNLLLGEITARTNKQLQLVGLAGKYLGRVGRNIMAVIIYLMSFGVLLAYIIGEGESLHAILGGAPLTWGLIFCVAAFLIIFFGLNAVRRVGLVLTFLVFTVVILIVGLCFPHIQAPHLQYSNLVNFLFPYGVLLFAFNSIHVVPEAHVVLKNRDLNYKRAIIIAGLIVMVLYLLFTLAVVGVTGSETTEIATIGLGKVAGETVSLLGNLFAVLAMGTVFMVMGLSFKDSLVWDLKLNKNLAALIVCGVPLTLYLFGLRSFIVIIDFVGGLLVSLQMFLILLIYWRAKQSGDLKKSSYHVHHVLLVIALLILALTVGAVYSVGKMF
jgi:tyrosine-specific transport protein